MYSCEMNKNYGTKWFTFYTKVRPVFGVLTGLSLIGDFLQYKEIYFQYWWMILYLLAGLAQPILSIIVAVKSDGDYPSFVKFVKYVLIFEVLNMSYQQFVEQYSKTSFNFEYSLLISLILLIIMYFLWYRLNMKYFTKRLILVTNDNIETEQNGEKRIDSPIISCKMDDYEQNNKTTFAENTVEDNTQQSFLSIKYCRICGNKLLKDSKFCSKCGTKVINEE